MHIHVPLNAKSSLKYTPRHIPLNHAITIVLLLFSSFLYLASFDLMTRYLEEGQQSEKAASKLDGTHFR